MTGVRSLILLLATLYATGTARPQLPWPPDQRIDVPSLALTDDQFLGGDPAPGRPIVVSGVLQFPNFGTDLPVVILMHGSGGPGFGSGASWAAFLNGLGIAAFRLDSYTGRGVAEVATDQGRVGHFEPIYDMYRAVEALAAHPAIDPERIAVMGFSRGGIPALYGAMERFHALYGPESGRIAAYLPVYPPCNFVLESELAVVGAPIRELHGTFDQWNPIPPCTDYLARLAEAGADADQWAYPGGQHGFDNPARPAYVVNSSAQTSRACRRIEAGGRLLNADSGLRFTYTDACVEYGPPEQYHTEAARAAQGDVRAFLTGLFGLP